MAHQAPEQDPISRHYHRPNLLQQILQALQNAGISRPGRRDLGAVDEFHVRGAAVSAELAQRTAPAPGSRVLDVGCALGGSARMLAAESHCQLTGIDISQAYMETANALSELCGLQQQTRFLQADALNLPFPNTSFDIAWTQHVQMNIADKHRFYTELKRVLIPGGRLIYYDVFQGNKRPIAYPMPWAEDSSVSFLIRHTQTQELLRQYGFRPVNLQDETAAGIRALAKLSDNAAEAGLPELSLQLLMGPDTRLKLSNLLLALQQGALELHSGIWELQPDAS